MNNLQLLKQQLHDVSSEAEQSAGELADFKATFSQHAAQVHSLISGTASGADKEIAQILDAAASAVASAVGALEAAATGCRTVAGQIGPG